MMQAEAPQAVLIQWKETLTLIIAFCTVVSLLFQGTKKALKTFFDVHAKPLMEGVAKEINGVSSAVNAIRTDHELKFREVAMSMEQQRKDINEGAKRLDAHDDELQDHETRIAVLESRVEAA